MRENIEVHDEVTGEIGRIIEDDGHELVIEFGRTTEVWTHSDFESSSLKTDN